MNKKRKITKKEAEQVAVEYLANCHPDFQYNGTSCSRLLFGGYQFMTDPDQIGGNWWIYISKDGEITSKTFIPY